jgi:hypothetical protein
MVVIPGFLALLVISDTRVELESLCLTNNPSHGNFRASCMIHYTPETIIPRKLEKGKPAGLQTDTG